MSNHVISVWIMSNFFSIRQGAEFDLEGLDTTWNDSQAAHRTEEDRIPQFDGADDEKPPTGKSSYTCTQTKQLFCTDIKL